MSTRVYTRPSVRYLGNSNTAEVHDLTREKSNCQVAWLLAMGHGAIFNPDTLDRAVVEGYDRCHYCIGSSLR